MTREDIKKEALDFSKRKYGEEYQYPMAKTQACCWGFVNGAEWRINSVWHNDLKNRGTQKAYSGPVQERAVSTV